MVGFDIDLLEKDTREYAEPRGARIDRIGHTVVVTPTGQGWPFMVRVDGDEATVLLPLGARLGVGWDGVDCQPLTEVVQSVVDGRVQVWLGSDEGGHPEAPSVRVWWGRNAIGSGDERGGPVVVGVPYSRCDGEDRVARPGQVG